MSAVIILFYLSSSVWLLNQWFSTSQFCLNFVNLWVMEFMGLYKRPCYMLLCTLCCVAAVCLNGHIAILNQEQKCPGHALASWLNVTLQDFASEPLLAIWSRTLSESFLTSFLEFAAVSKKKEDNTETLLASTSLTCLHSRRGSREHKDI